MTGGYPRMGDIAEQPAMGKSLCNQVCRECGDEIEQRSGQGRPRIYCEKCRPRGAKRTVRLTNSRACVGGCGTTLERSIDGLRLKCDECKAKTESAKRARYNARRLESATARAQSRQKTHLRRLVKAAGTLSLEDEIALRAAASECPLCEVPLTDDPGPQQRNLDHVVPLAIGGSHERENVRIVCRTCNLRRPHDGSDVEPWMLVGVRPHDVATLEAARAARRSERQSSERERAERAAVRRRVMEERRALRRIARRQGRDILVLCRVRRLRIEGCGYKRIARELGVDRDRARDLVKRAAA